MIIFGCTNRHISEMEKSIVLTLTQNWVYITWHPHVKDHPYSSPPNRALEGKKQKKKDKKRKEALLTTGRQLSSHSMSEWMNNGI
jgi:hypothetical protein